MHRSPLVLLDKEALEEADMLLDAYGNATYVAPSPSTSVENRVNEELARSFDPLLKIVWFPLAYVDPGKQRAEGRYALVHKWRDNDPRWADVGPDYPEAHDWLGWFCTDMHDASSVPVEPDQMMERVRELLWKADNARFPWKERMLKAIEHNARVREDAKQAILDEAADDAASRYYHTSKAARVFQQGG
jgi:hypothetical protein